jgi:predicted MFS family arabinose efflux permease
MAANAASRAIDTISRSRRAGGAEGGRGAVLALTLCVATLIASEFMPVSILTPIAFDLHLTEGAAGQAISVSGLFAVLTSLAISSLTAGIDRRILLLGLTVLMLLSGVLVAFAPSFAVLMAGRALLGIAIGGFWSMSAATVMRLVPGDRVPRALALLNGGNALATTVAAPLGSFLGQYIGWRGAFFIVVPLAAITFAWQWLTLPPLESDRTRRSASALGLLRRPQARIGIAAVGMLFMGQFALFTYLRPFLEDVTRLSVSLLSLVLLIMGGAGLVGTWAIGRAVARSLSATLIAAPLLMAVLAIGLVSAGTLALPTAALLALWGFIGTAVPVAWWTWLSRTLPDDAEAGGGLMVAVAQLAITLGAGGGGLLFDALGYRATFLASAVALAASSLLALRASRSAPTGLFDPKPQGKDPMMNVARSTNRRSFKSGPRPGRRFRLGRAAAVIAAISMVSLANPPSPAKAQDMSNGADEFSEEAYRRAAEPKELYFVPGAGHVDLYDRVNLIPFDKLAAFFTRNL